MRSNGSTVERSKSESVAKSESAKSPRSRSTNVGVAAPPADDEPAREEPPASPPPSSRDSDSPSFGRSSVVVLIALVVLCIGAFAIAFRGADLSRLSAQLPMPASPFPPAQAEQPAGNDWTSQLLSLQDAAVRLPIAAALSTVLAYRPRRRGTPKRQLTVVQTQIILAIVGCIVMLVVGASLARAFGIVGAAGLIRYRAKVDDPKDAGVMLSTLAVGLASGVGQFALAAFATTFVLMTLWILESLEPEPYELFELTIATKDSPDVKAQLEQILRKHRVHFELRGSSADDVSYEVKVPLSRHTDTISESLAKVNPKQPLEVKWEKKKKDK